MPRPRAPWWMYGVAASILGFLVLMLYADLCGPGAIGAGLRFEDGRTVVVAVLPGYPAAHAGVEPGDRIITALGLPIHTLFDWRQAAENAEVGRPFPLQIERNGQWLERPLSFDVHWRRWSGGTWLTFIVKVTAKLVVVGLALLIGFSRPHDRAALVGAWFLASISITDFSPIATLDPHSPTLPNGASAIWRSLPLWLGAPLWIATFTFVVGPELLTVFFAVFPRPVFRTKRAWWLFWLALSPTFLFFTPALLLLVYRTVYDPAHMGGTMPDWFTTSVGGAVVSAVAAGMALLVLNYSRLVDRNERRRVRVLALGALVGLAGASLSAMADFFTLPSGLQSVLRSPVGRTWSSLLFLMFPLSFAYAVLRHRLFDVGLMLRQGLQYALARRLVVALVPACAVILVIDLLVHGDQPLWAVVQSRGWAYAVVAGLALAAHTRQQRWLQALDRRFFRERYDAQRLLREVVEQIREATSLEQVAPQVVARIEAALHPEFAALLVRAPRDAAYRVLASTSGPGHGTAPSLPGDSKLVALVRLLGKPLDITLTDSGWLRDQLPQGETEFLRQTRIGLLGPIATEPGRPEALLALGLKRSEEPYSREDQELLVAVTASLGLLADRPASPRVTDAFEECPRCGACYDAGAISCAQEGATLTTIHLPRVLGERYRLERRLGRGGMGTVYEASDTSLERRIAVKVIREDLVGSAETAERFRREARAAAGFSHPNVVTVHDFGVAAKTRAYLVMELLRGATLRETLRAERRLAPDRALSMLRDLCAGVHAAHQQQLVHRDLKPENVFLMKDTTGERVKLLDFGIAKFFAGDDQTSAATGTGQVIGTLHYIGPEQLRGGAVDASWDLWALAVMAYEMLTGALPFAATTPVDYQSAVLAGRFTPIRAHIPETSERLQEFFVRAFAMDPGGRLNSAPRFVADFERALATPSPS